MNIFDILNEVAVLGTTFLLMAVSTVWYSTMLFGRFLSSDERNALSHDSLSSSQKALLAVCTFIGYFVALCGIGYFVAVAPLLSLTPSTMALYLALFGSALSTLPLIAENRSLRTVLVHIGFTIVFVCVGALVINYWPW